MTEKRAEQRAAQLLDDFISKKLRGQAPNAEEYLARCPAGEREHLQDALGGLDLVFDYHYTCVDEAFVDKTLARLQAIQRKKRQVAEWQQQLARLSGIPVTNPIDYLVQQLQIPPVALAASGGTARAAGQPSVRYRGASPAGTGYTAAAVDAARIKLMEEQLRDRAAAVLQQAEIATAPVNLYQIATALYLCVQETPLEGIDGCIISTGEAGIILLNSTITNSSRRRFTFAHEIGHFVLHRHLRSHADTAEMLQDYSSLEESGANIFAAQLLMPASFLPSNFGVEPPSFDQAERLQQAFDVSLVAALRRMVRQSNWGCALAVTRDGVLQWSVKSDDFTGWISARPHAWSGATRLMEPGAAPEIIDTLPAQVWMEGIGEDDDAEAPMLRQHSRRMGDGYVYTLLSLPDHGR